MKANLYREISFYLRSYWRFQLASILIGLTVGGSSAALMALISNRVASRDSPASIVMWIFTGLVCLELCSLMVSGILSIRLQQQTRLDQSLRICRLVLDSPLRQIEEVGGHKILSMLTSDIHNIAGLFLRLPQFCINLAISTGCIAYLAWLSLPLFAVFQPILLLAIIGYLIPEKKAKVYLQKGREEWDRVIGNYQALNEGMKELKLHHSRREAYFEELLIPSHKQVQKHNLAGGVIYQVLGGWNQMLYFVVVGLILFTLPAWYGEIQSHVMTGYALTIMYLRGPLTGLISAIPSWRAATVSLQRLEGLGVSLSGDEYLKSDSDELNIAPGNWHLSLTGVTHSYYHEGENMSFTLGPIDFDLRPGKILFIVGGNGSGKTTLAKVLTGLYEPESGEIRVNGELIGSHNRDAYRQCFSAIFTDFFLFDKLLGLYHPKLDELADGYLSDLKLAQHVKVLDGRFSTTKLSYGQRKRLALLNTFLEDRLIYVFDEWAAGQDPAFKEIFYCRILPDLKARGKAVVVVSHDDRYFHTADSLIKLEDGELVWKEAA